MSVDAGLKDTCFDLTRKARDIISVLERALADEPLYGDDLAIANAHGYPFVKSLRDNLDGYRAIRDLDLKVNVEIEPTPHRADEWPCECGRAFKSPLGRLNHRNRSKVHSAERVLT